LNKCDIIVGEHVLPTEKAPSPVDLFSNGKIVVNFIYISKVFKIILSLNLSVKYFSTKYFIQLFYNNSNRVSYAINCVKSN